MRPGKYIIGFSMAVIAGCLGFVLTVVGGAPVALSVTMALMALAVLVLIHLLFSLSRERRAMSEQVNDLTETVAHCMRQVTAVTQRLDELHADVTARVDGETREMRQEVTLVADAVRELADVLEARFGTSPEPAEPAVAHAAPAPQPQPAPAPEQMAPAPQAPAPVMLEPVAPAPVTYAPAIPEPVIHAPVTQAPMAPAPAAPAPVVQTPVAQEPPQPTVAPLAPQAVAEPAPNRVPAAGLPELGRIVPEPLDRSAEIAPTLPETQPIPAEKPALSGSEFGPHALFADAIADGRADIFLQPIVNLPQRRVQFYEAITRIRTLSAGFVDPAVYRRAIADHPAIVDLELRTLSRALVISKRLSQRGREVRIFMPLSARALADTGFLTEARTLLERNRAIGGAIILEIAQSDLGVIGPVEEEAMAALGDLGPRYALSGVRSFRFDPADIAKRRFRFVRSEASVLLGGGGAISPDIHPADLAGLMARYNMRLIATGVTIEQTAIDLLDYDVPLAQGDLFSAPRPVRSDILAEDQPVESGRRATG